MKFVTFYPETKNVHLVKDIGMLPYKLHILYGYDSYVACYMDDEAYPFLDKQVKGLKLIKVEKKYSSRILNGLRFIRMNAGDIDILNIYHLNLSSFFYAMYFKIKKKKGAKLYLKLDMSYAGLKTCLAHNPVGLIKRNTIRLSDIISVEASQLQDTLKKCFSKKVANRIIRVQNGFFMPDKPEGFSYNKEKVILTVGNLGTIEKATDTLLMGFAKSAPYHEFKLRLIGSVAPDFKGYIDDFLKEHEDIADRIDFYGTVSDKEKLAQEYRKSAIFILPSRQEAFSLALIEAAGCGCYMITSDKVTAGYDVTARYRFGSCFIADDTDDLAKTIREVCSLNDFDARASEIEEYTKEHFNWETILESLRNKCEE